MRSVLETKQCSIRSIYVGLMVSKFYVLTSDRRVYVTSPVQSAVHAPQELVLLDNPDHCQWGLRLRFPLHVATIVPQLQTQVGGAPTLASFYVQGIQHFHRWDKLNLRMCHCAIGHLDHGFFSDDLFAFIITMPTAHRVACFRDDVVFLIYLYQRYLYPVDPNRVDTRWVQEPESKQPHEVFS